MSEKPVVRNSGSGDAYWMLGGLYEVLLSSDDTNGASTIIQFTIPEGAGPPPHVHNCNEDVYAVGRFTGTIDPADSPERSLSARKYAPGWMYGLSTASVPEGTK